jgi:hypothetical protein
MSKLSNRGGASAVQQERQNYETRRETATGSDVFTHLPRLFGFLAKTSLTPARRFDRCRESLLIATFPHCIGRERYARRTSK